MDIGSVESVLALKQAQTQEIAQIKILKKKHEMQMSLIEMVSDLVRSAPAPEGHGLLVDTTA
jgi:hypothetical protein